MTFNTLFFIESSNLFVFITIFFGIIDYIFKKFRYKLFICYLLIILCLMFFYRIPMRKNRISKNYVLSPCDGTVKSIIHLPNGLTHIAIYLNIFNAHIQWAPIDGKIIEKKYKKGTFKPAHILEKSKYNERLETLIYSPLIKKHIKLVQIAGQIVRRIVNYTQTNDIIKRGQIIGMIKLSSRIDLFLPTKNIQLHIKENDQLLGNNTIIGKMII